MFIKPKPQVFFQTNWSCYPSHIDIHTCQILIWGGAIHKFHTCSQNCPSTFCTKYHCWKLQKKICVLWERMGMSLVHFPGIEQHAHFCWDSETKREGAYYHFQVYIHHCRCSKKLLWNRMIGIVYWKLILFQCMTKSVYMPSREFIVLSLHFNWSLDLFFSMTACGTSACDDICDTS